MRLNIGFRAFFFLQLKDQRKSAQGGVAIVFEKTIFL